MILKRTLKKILGQDKHSLQTFGSPLYAFILSYERPIHLWATLDSFYRNTRSDVRFVLIDNNSHIPLVRQVIKGFIARDFFYEVKFNESNDPEAVRNILKEYRSRLGELFFYIENDVVVQPSERCWAQSFSELMASNPRYAMIGSKIDPSDFVDPRWLEKKRGHPLTEQEKHHIKFYSPERHLDLATNELGSPFNPPGRFLALRTDPVLEVGMRSDAELHRRLIRNNWETGIYGGVVHRHLSLLNFFDDPGYDMEQRNKFIVETT